MQSGTILHLALLRKLSSRSPKSNYSKRFARFRAVMKTSPPSAKLFQKYPSVESRNSLILNSSRSTLPLKVFKKKATFTQNDRNLNVCAWSIENQQDFDLLMKIKYTNNILTYKDQTKKTSQHAKPKFTFCDEEAKSFQRQSQKRDFGSKYSNIDDIKKVETGSSLTQSSIKQKQVISQKENIVKDPCQCLLTSFRRQGRKQTKQFTRNKKPLTELVITTLKQDF